MILVGVDWGKACFAGLAIPIEGIVVLIVDDIAHLLQLGLESLDTVGFLDFQTGKTRELELHAERTACYYDGLSQVWGPREIVFKLREKTAVCLQHYIRDGVAILKFALHTQQTEDVFHHRITLL